MRRRALLYAAAALALLPAALPLAAQPSPYDLLNAAREILGGKRLAEVHSLAVWGPDRRGTQSTEAGLSIDLTGRFLKENTTLSNGGEVQRMQMSDDGTYAPAAGGMPGDSGGPALTPFTAECLNGDQYWARLRASSLEGAPEATASARKHAFVESFARYALAFTLSPPTNYPVTFAYGGQVDSPGGMADGIIAKGPDGFLVRLFLDTKTHMPVMIAYSENGQDVQMWLRDYRAESGILFPHDLAWISNGRLTEEFLVKKVSVNPRFPDKKFKQFR
jgi:hypothetical protein